MARNSHRKILLRLYDYDSQHREIMHWLDGYERFALQNVLRRALEIGLPQVLSETRNALTGGNTLAGGEQTPGGAQTPGGTQAPNGEQSPRMEQSSGGVQAPDGETASRGEPLSDGTAIPAFVQEQNQVAVADREPDERNLRGEGPARASAHIQDAKRAIMGLCRQEEKQ